MANVKRRFVRQYPPEVSMCAGCNSCEAVCSLLHDGVVSPKQRRIFVERDTVMFMHTIHTCKHCGICYKKCPKRIQLYALMKMEYITLTKINVLAADYVLKPVRLNLKEFRWT